jgi:hypothetical protein
MGAISRVMTPVTGEMKIISPVTEMAFCHFRFLVDVFASFSRVLDLISRVFIFFASFFVFFFDRFLSFFRFVRRFFGLSRGVFFRVPGGRERLCVNF